jgi:hypothetical protein
MMRGQTGLGRKEVALRADQGRVESCLVQPGDELTHPDLRDLRNRNVHTLIIFKVTEDIPQDVWDRMPFDTKILGDFAEFATNRNDWTYTIEKNLAVMGMVLCGETRYDQLFGRVRRAVLAVHGDPLTLGTDLALLNVSPVFKQRYPEDWQTIARDQGSAYLNEYLLALGAGYKKQAELQLGDYSAPLLLPPEDLCRSRIPDPQKVLGIAREIMEKTFAERSGPHYTEKLARLGIG